MKQSAFKESDKHAFTKDKWASAKKKPIQHTKAVIKSSSNPQTGNKKTPISKLTNQQIMARLNK
jgi:hypothetical protein